MTDATEARLPEHVEPPTLRPAQVSAAFWVFLSLIAVRLVLLPFTAIHQWSITDNTLAASRAKYGAPIAAQTAGILHGVTITSDVIVVALYGLCLLAALRLRRGVAWARIVLTVLGAVSITTAAFGWSSPIGVAMGAAGIAGIVLLWLRPSNAWFRATIAARRAEAQSRAEARTLTSVPPGS
jgi:hypothetical protein